MADLMSINPVFSNFTIPDGTSISVTYKEGAGDAKAQDVAHLLALLSVPDGAKMGYGNGNKMKDGQADVPFSTPYAGIPWGRAVLCKAETSGSTVALEALDADNIHGTCYGITIRNSSPQLNCGMSVSGAFEGSAEPTLVVAVMVNAKAVEEDGAYVLAEGETVLAISEAIDPTVINVGNTSTLKFDVPKATGGFKFTVRGTLAKAPFVRFVPTYTSFKDVVSSYPTSQAIIDAKASST